MNISCYFSFWLWSFIIHWSYLRMNHHLALLINVFRGDSIWQFFYQFLCIPCDTKQFFRTPCILDFSSWDCQRQNDLYGSSVSSVIFVKDHRYLNEFRRWFTDLKIHKQPLQSILSPAKWNSAFWGLSGGVDFPHLYFSSTWYQLHQSHSFVRKKIWFMDSYSFPTFWGILPQRTSVAGPKQSPPSGREE